MLSLRRLLLFAFLVSFPGPFTPSILVSQDRESDSEAGPDPQVIQNLTAFAKLYGYVRFFHPSDQTMEIDWDRFAVYGARSVMEAEDREGLQKALESLFFPIAPTVQIFPSNRPAPSPMDLGESTRLGGEMVAWQHLGVEAGVRRPPYGSVRANAGDLLWADGSGIGTFSQTLSAEGLRGRKLKLTVSVRTEVKGRWNGAGVWARADREGRPNVGTGTRNDPPSRRPAWERAEVVVEVPDGTEHVVLGGYLLGSGVAWFDDIEAYSQGPGDEWIRVTLRNPGFENKDGEKPMDWATRGNLYDFRSVPSGGVDDSAGFRIERGPDIRTENLFEALPEAGEVWKQEIGAGLSGHVPISMWVGADGTVGPTSGSSLNVLKETLASVDTGEDSVHDPAARAAGIIIAWNVFQHFYPYFDVMEVDWNGELRTSLARALEDQDREDFYYTLRRLLVGLGDSHAFVQRLGSPAPPGKVVLGLDWIEDQVVVTVSKDPNVQPGDVVLSIDGVDTHELIRLDEELLSGSPQYRRSQAVWRRLGMGPEGVSANIMLKRGLDTVEVEVPRGPWEVQLEEQRGPIEEMDGGILYLNMARIQTSDLLGVSEDLEKATGVIFDFRTCNLSPRVEGFLLEAPHTSSSWLSIPRTIYPDRDRPLPPEDYGMAARPGNVRIGGKAAFLTNAQTLGDPESQLIFVEHYGLGEIVGSPTAGAFAGIHSFSVPGEFTIPFTMQYGVKLDGTGVHGIGIQPTVPVARTIQGVLEGRDEVLEAALRLVREGS